MYIRYTLCTGIFSLTIKQLYAFKALILAVKILYKIRTLFIYLLYDLQSLVSFNHKDNYNHWNISDHRIIFGSHWKLPNIFSKKVTSPCYSRIKILNLVIEFSNMKTFTQLNQWTKLWGLLSYSSIGFDAVWQASASVNSFLSTFENHDLFYCSLYNFVTKYICTKFLCQKSVWRKTFTKVFINCANRLVDVAPKVNVRNPPRTGDERWKSTLILKPTADVARSPKTGLPVVTKSELYN